jgi:hypothetical protein
VKSYSCLFCFSLCLIVSLTSCIRKQNTLTTTSPSNKQPLIVSPPKTVTPTNTQKEPEKKQEGWTLETGYRWKELHFSSAGKNGFTLMPPKETQVDFKNNLSDNESIRNQILNGGSGVAAGDFNQDGLCDLYFCQLEGPNALYQNLGNWKFKNVTQEVSLENTDISCAKQYSTGATFADIDGDGNLDLIVTSLESTNRCFLNNGKGKFSEVSTQVGFNTNLGSTSIALADMDNDGDLDLYITNYRTSTYKDFGGDLLLHMNEKGHLIVPPHYKDRLCIDGEITLNKTEDGRYVIPENIKRQLTSGGSALREYGEVDLVYFNDGKGNFTPLSFLSGSFLDETGKILQETPKDWGLAVMLRDMNDDRHPDIYVCNDFWTPDRIWINQGNGTFQAIDPLAVRNISATSMGVDFADIDRDGDYDYFVVDMLSQEHKRRKMQMGTMRPTPIEIGLINNRPQLMRNTLALNRGDGTYAEVALYAGLQDTEWSWCPVFLDVDLDGYEDVYVTNGNARDVQDADTINRISAMKINSVETKKQMMLMYPRLQTANLFYHNQKNLTFKNKSEEWGVAQERISHGVATADFDNDGDIDFAINNLYDTAGIYRNNATSGRIGVRLKGKAPNTQGIGADVRLLGGAVPLQRQEALCGGRYLSGGDPYLAFATGNTQEGMTLEVLWRNGKKSVLSQVKANRIYEIDEAFAQDIPPVVKTPPTPHFKDVSDALNHTHTENEFDDFKYQLLLPNRLSQLGPGILWIDVDQDQDDDLLIGTGKGGKLTLFRNEGNGKFTPHHLHEEPAPHDQVGLVAWNTSKGTQLLVGSSNFEDNGAVQGHTATLYSSSTEKNSWTSSALFEAIASSTGPLALADVDNDGDLDVFVGGRTIPKQYPVPSTSRLFLNHEGSFLLDTANAPTFENCGMISSATFSDLDNDGDPDLLLAPEWGPVTIFINQKGIFTKISTQTPESRKTLTDRQLEPYAKWDLSAHLGWWNGVTTGDLNGDGRLDIIATNWGQNSKYHYYPGHPLKIYYNDFDKNGVLDIVEAHYDKKVGAVVPERGLSCSSRCMPFIREKLPTYERFGSATLEDIYGESIFNQPFVEANELSHLLFLNRGTHFDVVPLPVEAQLAPSFGVHIADLDGDSHEDVFMTLNFFASQIETPRCDAGRSLWLKGDGQGNLTPVEGQVSGILVYGDPRGSSLSDFNQDGRIDLTISQNGAQTKLYENQKATPGIRIYLVGSDQNRSALGAIVRLGDEGKLGPAREIRGGSGYWSQDSSVIVMSLPRFCSKTCAGCSMAGRETYSFPLAFEC